MVFERIISSLHIEQWSGWEVAKGTVSEIYMLQGWMAQYAPLPKRTMTVGERHYQAALNHLPAAYSIDLETAAWSAAPDPDIPIGAPTLVEGTRAIRRLKNGKAAGPDGIASEDAEVRRETSLRSSA